jgi:hypothetical protein
MTIGSDERAYCSTLIRAMATGRRWAEAAERGISLWAKIRNEYLLLLISIFFIEYTNSWHLMRPWPW